MKKLTLFILFLCLGSKCYSQLQKPVTWSYASKHITTTEVVVYFKAILNEGWHIYATDQPEGGPVKTSFKFLPSKEFILLGKISQPLPHVKRENVFNMDVRYFDKVVIFSQRIRLKAKGGVLKVKIEFMACTNKECLPPEEVAFNVPIK